MITLAIETSCDETAASVVELDDHGYKIHSNVVSSHIDLFRLYGGVVPELASREHLSRLPIVVDKALEPISLDKIDLISVTTGPGLKGCLLIGKDYAQGLALSAKKEIVGVHHIEGHILSVFLEHDVSFPFLSLVISGGHTEIVLVRGIAQYERISKTKDDASGEAFDKSATLLGLPYPGGAALSKLAEGGSSLYPLPIGLKRELDFSFSGLKTAVRILIDSKKDTLDQERENLAASIQEAIASALYQKTKQASALTGCRRISLCGGVSVNSLVRKKFLDDDSLEVFCVSPHLCTDNAAMIGVAALLRKKAGCTDSELKITPRISILERNSP